MFLLLLGLLRCDEEGEGGLTASNEKFEGITIQQGLFHFSNTGEEIKHQDGLLLLRLSTILLYVRTNS